MISVPLTAAQSFSMLGFRVHSAYAAITIAYLRFELPIRKKFSQRDVGMMHFSHLSFAFSIRRILLINAVALRSLKSERQRRSRHQLHRWPATRLRDAESRPPPLPARRSYRRRFFGAAFRDLPAAAILTL